MYKIECNKINTEIFPEYKMACFFFVQKTENCDRNREFGTDKF